ncbi:MAG: hypothetical protein ACKPJJ_17350 [Planctomycetaceae bacterium]
MGSAVCVQRTHCRSFAVCRDYRLCAGYYVSITSQALSGTSGAGVWCGWNFVGFSVDKGAGGDLRVVILRGIRIWT